MPRGKSTFYTWTLAFKAFDSVLRDLLVMKIKKFGFTGKFLKWFEWYLYGRQQRAVISECKSGWLNVASGVPQGSIMGPLFFLLYINDLPKSINSIVTLFADDSKAFKQVRSQNDCYDFQEDIDNYYYWSKKWLMNCNVLKCHVITITNNKSPVLFCFKMNAVQLECVTDLLDLGINVDSTLSWSPHNYKQNRVRGLIKRTLVWHAPQQTNTCYIVLWHVQCCNTVHVHRYGEEQVSLMCAWWNGYSGQ